MYINVKRVQDKIWLKIYNMLIILKRQHCTKSTTVHELSRKLFSCLLGRSRRWYLGALNGASLRIDDIRKTRRGDSSTISTLLGTITSNLLKGRSDHTQKIHIPLTEENKILILIFGYPLSPPHMYNWNLGCLLKLQDDWTVKIANMTIRYTFWGKHNNTSNLQTCRR